MLASGCLTAGSPGAPRARGKCCAAELGWAPGLEAAPGKGSAAERQLCPGAGALHRPAGLRHSLQAPRAREGGRERGKAGWAGSTEKSFFGAKALQPLPGSVSGCRAVQLPGMRSRSWHSPQPAASLLHCQRHRACGLPGPGHGCRLGSFMCCQQCPGRRGGFWFQEVFSQLYITPRTSLRALCKGRVKGGITIEIRSFPESMISVSYSWGIGDGKYKRGSPSGTSH